MAATRTQPEPATWAHLEQVIRTQLTYCAISALRSGVLPTAAADQAVKQIMAAARDVARAEQGGA